MNTRHAERVEGCGSPVETSARSAEAPTEPAGETKSFCPCQNKKTPAGVFLFWLGLNNLNTRHAERVEGCGSPVETSARSAEAPTEPAGETKSFCPCQKETVTVLVTVSFFVRQNLSEARACRASSPSAAGGRCSEARMAQRSKYGVTPPYFGHRKRGCEATSSPSVKTPLKSAPLS